ncbi:hypothetical protein BELL_0219g00010 [Botrytis elliptica]|uniref:2EXR domain-containing protein n=1 Tax=Botrytis elliptica TaxID=278938 RepID=A0A4Z1JPD6_9HELO|nr:hypothetical protein BELL_0219g00010 [Botrytis elliptica]
MNSQDQSSDQALAQDQSSNSRSLVDFTLFPQLSPDLRVMIWKATLTPRVFSRRCLSVNSNQPLNSVNIPSLLSVDAETRYEALKWYKDIAISAERLHNLRRANFWLPRGEKLRILFNPEIDVIVDENLRCDVYPLFINDDVNANTPRRSPLLIDPDFVKKVQVSPEVFMNSSWTWDQMLRNWQDNYYGFEDIGLWLYEMNLNRFMFTDLRFNNLNEFILQDVDCALPHQLDSPDTRATCKRFLSTMFQAETTRESKAHIQVSIPKIIVLPGAKSMVERLRTDCEEVE